MENWEIRDPGLPFYTWECVTLQLGNRDVYIVIQNEKLLTGFIKLLVYYLQTIDGNRNSAIPLKTALFRKLERKYFEEIGRKTVLMRSKRVQFEEDVEN